MAVVFILFRACLFANNSAYGNECYEKWIENKYGHEIIISRHVREKTLGRLFAENDCSVETIARSCCPFNKHTP